MTTSHPAPTGAEPVPLRIVHLFPELLGVYGDGGNVRVLVGRARARGIPVMVAGVHAGDRRVPSADLLVIGGGQDREQQAVARSLDRIGDAVVAAVAGGTALLAICGGFQSLGRSYRTAGGLTLDGPAIFDIRTEAESGRLVGPVIAKISGSSWSERGFADRTIVGFENHSGRTELAPGVRPLALIVVGAGNNGRDKTEGVLAWPGEGGFAGMRIGTYLHGPLLPRNPHLADALLSAARVHSGADEALLPLDDRVEWEAHDAYEARVRRHERIESRVPGWAHRFVDAPRSLIGY